MAKKAEKTTRRTNRAPAHTIEVGPTLTPEEYAEFIDVVEAAEVPIETREIAGYDPDVFEDRVHDPSQ